jgi:hypothetical protein
LTTRTRLRAAGATPAPAVVRHGHPRRRARGGADASRPARRHRRTSSALAYRGATGHPASGKTAGRCRRGGACAKPLSTSVRGARLRDLLSWRAWRVRGCPWRGGEGARRGTGGGRRRLSRSITRPTPSGRVVRPADRGRPAEILGELTRVGGGPSGGRQQRPWLAARPRHVRRWIHCGRSSWVRRPYARRRRRPFGHDGGDSPALRQAARAVSPLALAIDGSSAQSGETVRAVTKLLWPNGAAAQRLDARRGRANAATSAP